MNLHKGLKRLTLVLSILSGTIIIIYFIAIGEGPSGFFVDLILAALIICGGGFLTAWAIYGSTRWVIVPVVRWIVKGFRNENNVENKSNG